MRSARATFRNLGAARRRGGCGAGFRPGVEAVGEQAVAVVEDVADDGVVAGPEQVVQAVTVAEDGAGYCYENEGFAVRGAPPE